MPDEINFENAESTGSTATLTSALSLVKRAYTGTGRDT